MSCSGGIAKGPIILLCFCSSYSLANSAVFAGLSLTSVFDNGQFSCTPSENPFENPSTIKSLSTQPSSSIASLDGLTGVCILYLSKSENKG